MNYLQGVRTTLTRPVSGEQHLFRILFVLYLVQIVALDLTFQP